MITKKLFLAGPINGSESWRPALIKYLNATFEFIIEKRPTKKFEYKPRRSYSASELVGIHQLYIYNPQDVEEKEKFTHARHALQIEWETEKLAKSEVIAFYIPAPERVVDDFGKTTRFELGEWIGKISLLGKVISDSGGIILDNSLAKIILYVDDSFSGGYYFKKRISDIILQNEKLKNFIIVTENDENFKSALIKALV